MLKIGMVGAGRIAWHLGKRLKSKGLPITQVLSRTPEHAQELAQALGCEGSSDWADADPDTDWLILAVRDDAIHLVADEISPYIRQALVTHTSGATPGEVLAPHFKRYGVFYPLQSFSPQRNPVWSKIPFCVHANSDDDVLFLTKMAKNIGNLVYRVNDEQRVSLHVAAVFANNFTNHCFAIAEKLLDDKNLPFELLHPLMEETISKALQDSPFLMQTGPAVRGDSDTIERHLMELLHEPNWQKVYKVLTQSIESLHPSQQE
jgi:predicted short-subunit dehydrogenase-like oxidoreductase (DUF2520 family)